VLSFTSLLLSLLLLCDAVHPPEKKEASHLKLYWGNATELRTLKALVKKKGKSHDNEQVDKIDHDYDEVSQVHSHGSSQHREKEMKPHSLNAILLYLIAILSVGNCCLKMYPHQR
jgi:hypothetical protein